MKYFKALACSALVAGLFAGASASPAQIGIGVNIGPAPICPYGYFDYPPYDCAPYGYYGPDWFLNGVFIGAGPWFHGPHGFYGHVDRHYDPHYGYHGPYPGHDEHFDSHRDFHDFHGGYMRDGHGHERADDHGHR